MTFTPELMSAFSDELVKLSSAPAKAAKMSGKMKALLGLTAAGGVAAGAAGEQAKDDIFSGRRMRQQQARAQGVSQYTL
jgi:hypothetical protein